MAKVYLNPEEDELEYMVVFEPEFLERLDKGFKEAEAEKKLKRKKAKAKKAKNG